MASRKTKQVIANLEPVLWDAVTQYCKDNDISKSTYARSAILRDMLNRGLVPQEALQALLMAT